MSLASIIYHNPTDFHRYITAYPIPQRRRGIVFATLMGYDTSMAISATPMDMMTHKIIAAITDVTNEIPSWVPTYTFGFETDFSRERLPQRRHTVQPISPAPTPLRTRIIHPNTRRDADAAAVADGSRGANIEIIKITRPRLVMSIKREGIFDVSFVF